MPRHLAVAYLFLVRPKRGLTIGAVKFEIPDWLDARDDDGTLVAYPPASDYANVRAFIICAIRVICG